jgi:hypothetical protein
MYSQIPHAIYIDHFSQGYTEEHIKYNNGCLKVPMQFAGYAETCFKIILQSTDTEHDNDDIQYNLETLRSYVRLSRGHWH